MHFFCCFSVLILRSSSSSARASFNVLSSCLHCPGRGSDLIVFKTKPASGPAMLICFSLLLSGPVVQTELLERLAVTIVIAAVLHRSVYLWEGGEKDFSKEEHPPDFVSGWWSQVGVFRLYLTCSRSCKTLVDTQIMQYPGVSILLLNITSSLGLLQRLPAAIHSASVLTLLSGSYSSSPFGYWDKKREWEVKESCQFSSQNYGPRRM